MIALDSANAELARRSLLAFGKRVEAAFTDAPHIKFLAGLLEQLEVGAIGRLVVSMPPRFGKTTLASMLFSAFCIGRDPTRSIILANHSAELAASFSRKAKGYVESPAWPFRKIELSEDSRAVHRWHVTPGGGGLVSVGVGSGITGIGCDILVVDDPVNDALSETERNQAWDWYRQIAFPRLNSGGRVLVVSARLAMDDLPGRIAEADDANEYRFVSLPAVNQEDNELGLEPGTPLWPEKFGARELEQRREAMGLAAFEAQYMQNPSIVAGGQIFRLSDFPTWERLPKAEQPAWDPLNHFYISPLDAARPDGDAFVKITAVDAAGTENTSTGGSHNAIVTILANLIDGNAYIVDVERSRNIDFYALRSQVMNHAARHGPSLIVIENEAAGSRLIGDLSRSTRWPIKAVNPKASKVDRALLVIGSVESGKVHLPARAAWKDALCSELAQFGPGARFTDQVDALVWSLLAFRQYVAARREDQFYARQLEGFNLFGS